MSYHSQGKGKRAHPRGRSPSQLFPQHLLQPARLPGQTVTSAKGRGRPRTVPREEPGESRVRASCQLPLTAGYATAERLRSFLGSRASPSPLLPAHRRAPTPRGARTGWAPTPGSSPSCKTCKCAPQSCTLDPRVWPLPPRAALASRGCSPPPWHLRGPERPLLLPRGRPRLPLTSLVPEIAERPGAGPGARPGGAGGRSSAGPPRASRPAAAARPPRPCARPSLALGSDRRAALLAPEEADARQVQGARGWRGARAPLALRPPGQRGELELKPRPLLPQLPVPSRHAVAMARDREREEARTQRGLSGDVVSHLWQEGTGCVCETLQAGSPGAKSPANARARLRSPPLTQKQPDDFVGVSTAQTYGSLSL